MRATGAIFMSENEMVDVQALLDLAAKASPLPWKKNIGCSVDSGDVPVDGVRVCKTHTSTFAPPIEEAIRNAEYIVAACNAVPALVRCLQAAEAERDRLRALLRRFLDCDGDDD